jgi:hypothetical protein
MSQTAAPPGTDPVAATQEIAAQIGTDALAGAVTAMQQGGDAQDVAKALVSAIAKGIVAAMPAIAAALADKLPAFADMAGAAVRADLEPRLAKAESQITDLFAHNPANAIMADDEKSPAGLYELIGLHDSALRVVASVLTRLFPHDTAGLKPLVPIAAAAPAPEHGRMLTPVQAP